MKTLRRWLVLLLACSPGWVFAQTSVRVVGPNGSGGTDTAKVTNMYGAQTDVTRVQGANTTSSCTSSATGGMCATAMLGKQTFGVQVTAISSPSGITVVPEVSLDSGTTWKATWAENVTTSEPTQAITSFAVGDTYNFLGVTGATNYRLNVTARTSGSATFQATASDSITIYHEPTGTRFNCAVSAQSASGNCTGSASGAGLFYYITSVTMSSSVAQTLQVVTSATSGCGSGATNMTAAHYVPANGGFAQNYPVALKAGAVNSYVCCMRGTGASWSCDVQGYIAP